MKPFLNPHAEQFRKKISKKIKQIHSKRKNLIIQLLRQAGAPLTVSEWFGRLGNNIQQVSMGILYAQKHHLRFISPQHELIRSIAYRAQGPYQLLPKLKNRFFSFLGSESDPDTDLEYEYIRDNFYEVAQRYIYPNLLVQKLEPLDENCLVIHLRGGDIFSTTSAPHEYYVQNPLSYYSHLIKQFKRVIIVSEPGDQNPILPRLREEFSIEIQSSSVAEDFATLLRAKNLASSGVGTFAVAAALYSQNLQNFYYSDRYLTEHLNPEMLIGKVNTVCIRLPNYIKIGEWNMGDENRELLLNYQIPF